MLASLMIRSFLHLIVFFIYRRFMKNSIIGDPEWSHVKDLELDVYKVRK